ncbi:MAG: hypothetical protein R3B11_07385 [Nitrospira sp.]|nr:hypothetical protein [Fimbriimonadaceae bacterium]MDR4475819.1 hypothetical protein [Nitrospira sp.]
MRVRALRAAIVRIVQSQNIEQTKIGSFLLPARKKVWKALRAFWDGSEESEAVKSAHRKEAGSLG